MTLTAAELRDAANENALAAIANSIRADTLSPCPPWPWRWRAWRRTLRELEAEHERIGARHLELLEQRRQLGELLAAGHRHSRQHPSEPISHYLRRLS